LFLFDLQGKLADHPLQLCGKLVDYSRQVHKELFVGQELIQAVKPGLDRVHILQRLKQAGSLHSPFNQV
jgi:hypothetical protein